MSRNITVDPKGKIQGLRVGEYCVVFCVGTYYYFYYYDREKIEDIDICDPFDDYLSSLKLI